MDIKQWFYNLLRKELYFMEKDFKDIVVEKDLAGIDRIICGTLK